MIHRAQGLHVGLEGALPTHFAVEAAGHEVGTGYMRAGCLIDSLLQL